MASHTLLYLTILVISSYGELASAIASVHKLDPNGANPDEYLVAFKYDMPSGRQAASVIATVPGAELRREYNLGGRRFTLVRADDTALQILRASPEVELIESNQRFYRRKPLDLRTLGDFKATRVASPQAAVSAESKMCHVDVVGRYGWGIIRTGYTNLPDYSSAPYLFGDADSGEGVDIYILDSGIFVEHEDFEGRAVWGMTGDALVASGEGDLDLDGHGTHVAGTAAGKRFGIARKAKLIAVKVLGADGSGYWSDVVQGLEFVMEKHKEKTESGKSARSVVNLSLGGGSGMYSYITEIAMQEATEAGVHIAVAAGNDHEDACMFTPSRSSVVITVGATNINDSLASFSNFGPCVNILAPGRHIASAYIGGTQRYAVISGTSMASPHVVGVLARYLSQLSDAENELTTTAVVKATLTDMASRQKILFQGIGESATPNKLLLKTCAGSKQTTLHPNATTTTTRATTKLSTTTSTTTNAPTTKQSSTTTTISTTTTTGATSTMKSQTTTSTMVPTVLTTPRPRVEQTGSLDTLAPMLIGTLAVSSCMTALNVMAIISLLCIARKT